MSIPLGYFRAIERTTAFGCWIIGVMSAAVFILALMDHFCRLGLRMDYDHAWILLIVVATCGAIRLVLSGVSSIIK